MKPHLIAFSCWLLLLLPSAFVFAQQPALKNLYPFDQGKLKNPFKVAIPYAAKGAFTVKDEYTTTDKNYLKKARKTIYKRLLAVAKGTLDSLNKPQTGLSQLYIDLYGGAGELTNLRTNLGVMITALKKDAPLGKEDPLFPCIEDLITKLNAQKYHIEGKDLPLLPGVEIDIYEDDIVKQFFNGLMNSNCVGLNCKADANFDADKQDLEDLMQQAVLIKNVYRCTKNGDNALNDLFDKIEANPLYKWAKGDCLKKLFWLGGGSFKFNPFAQVTAYNWPTFYLYSDIIRQKVDSIHRCCENDLAKLQTLVMALKVDPAKFKGSTDKIFGYKSTKEITQMETFMNKIIIPVVTDKNCCATGYPDLYKKKWILNYDAADNYKMDQPCLKPTIPEDEQLIIAVNNIGADTIVIISNTEKSIADQSKAQSSLSDIGTGLSGAYAAVNPLAGIIGSFLTPPSVNLPSHVTISGSSVQTAVATTTTTSQPAVTPHNSLAPNKNQSQDRVLKQGKTVETSQKVLFVYLNVGDRTLTFPGATRKDALDAVIESIVGTDLRPLKAAEAYFLANCDETKLDNKSSGELRDLITKMIENFNKFYEENREWQIEDNKKLKTYIADLNYILNAADAQNPPKVIEDGSGDDAAKTTTSVYHTTLSTFARIDAPKQEDYVLTEETAKPVKGPAKTADPSASDSIKVNKVRGIYKVGKYYRFQVSAGLAVSTNNYVLNNAVVTNGVLTNTAKDQQASFVIGLHTYFCRLFNMDNSFLGLKNDRGLESHFWNRISLYTGIGIPDPTKNYFCGLSLDLLPGIKITGGEHFIIYTRYQLNNNFITGQQNVFHGASPFVSLNLDASFIGNLFSLFK